MKEEYVIRHFKILYFNAVTGDVVLSNSAKNVCLLVPSMQFSTLVKKPEDSESEDQGNT